MMMASFATVHELASFHPNIVLGMDVYISLTLDTVRFAFLLVNGLVREAKVLPAKYILNNAGERHQREPRSGGGHKNSQTEQQDDGVSVFSRNRSQGQPLSQPRPTRWSLGYQWRLLCCSILPLLRSIEPIPHIEMIMAEGRIGLRVGRPKIDKIDKNK